MVFSTILTKNLIKEFYILQKSLELTNPGYLLVVMCDDESASDIQKLNNPNIIVLNELKNLNYEEIKNRGAAFLDLVMRKCDVMDYSLKNYGETLFVDTDIVFLNKFDVPSDKTLILSQHHINPSDEDKYGKYNVGYMYVRDLSFPQWLRDTTKTRSKFFEQEGLIHAENEYDMSTFSMCHNFGWWRLFQCSDSQERYKKFGYGNNVYYDKSPLISIHAHTLSEGNKDPLNDKYVQVILKLLSGSKKEEHKKLLYFINSLNKKKPKIIVPHPSITDHSGDTFRELVEIWHEEGFCEREYSNATQLVWMNSIGDVLLYDRPTLQWLGNTKFNRGLFGNPVVNQPNAYPWIFWGRRPKLMNKIRKEECLKLFDDRDIESIFLGKVENSIQEQKRTNHDWSKSTQIFEMPIRGEYKYSQWEYLQLLSRSKFGLCLSGYGNKCNREIEYLCLGVVPIVTDGVDLTYYEHLTEDVHYLRVSTPEEIEPLIRNISDEKWNAMSNACLEWYERNCSPRGSFETTMKIVDI